MSKQYNKAIKKKRRLRYLKRKNVGAKTRAAAKAKAAAKAWAILHSFKTTLPPRVVFLSRLACCSAAESCRRTMAARFTAGITCSHSPFTAGMPR